MAIDRLSADDRLLLLSDARWPQDVGAVCVLDGGPLLDDSGRPRVEVAREAVARGLAELPRLRQVLRRPPRGLGGPYWVDDPSFDLAAHVRVVPALGFADDAALLDAVERIRRHRLDPRRPLWELWLIPGPASGRLALFVRMHHVVADGVAGVATLAALLRDRTTGTTGATGAPVVAPAWSPTPPPSRAVLFRDGLRRRGQAVGGGVAAMRHPRAVFASLGDAWHGIRDLVGGAPGPVTSLGGVVGPQRRLALVRARLDDVEEVARGQHATVNDVLLTVIAGGVRALLASRRESVDELVVPILVPVSLRRQPDGGAAGRSGLVGNRISQMAVELPVGEADPLARLRRISGTTARAKAAAHPAMGGVFRNRLIGAVVLRLVIRRRINLLSADIVGPASPLSFAGTRVQEVFPLINLLGNVTLGVGAMSYAGRFEVLVVADADLHPDVGVFAEGVAEELERLGAGLGSRGAAGPARGSAGLHGAPRSHVAPSDARRGL